MSGENLPGKHVSFWIASTPKTDFPRLKAGLEVDVAVIGGGIAGLATAYFLKEAGKKVAVLESRRILEGVTGHTTAKITSLHTLIYQNLVDLFGKEKAKLFGESQQTAIDKIEEISRKNNISCDFKRAAAYTYTQTAEKVNKIKGEAETAKNLGLPASFVETSPLPYPIKGAVRFDNQAHFHPRKFLLGLANLIQSGGGKIFEQTKVTEVKEGEPCLVVTERGEIRAKDVVVATHYPIFNEGGYFTRLNPLRSYVLGVYINGPVPEGMFINTETPLFSVRSQPTEKGQMLIITGQEHKTGQENNTIGCYEETEKLTRDRFSVSSIAYRWSTQDNYTIDGVPYIGKYTPGSQHLYVATGFNGWGMASGIVSAVLLTDLILGKETPWASVYDPVRLEQVKGVKNFLLTNVDVAQKFISSYLSGQGKEVVPKMKNGEAKVIKVNGQKLAVYKDEEGKIHVLSAKCTHLGCLVNWNKAEKSWDCPCHGSRFSPEGEILHDPAIYPLPKKEV
jgi:glycine/D-amino acid oxidase-like deaminating enzyme/nitrite reductase/ring-hydroxylating ferredoxin subunit